jgi:hypothetical protein
MQNKNKNDLVDIVILWVDGSDAKWCKKREKYVEDYKQKEIGKRHEGSSGAFSEARFYDFGTLKYLLRSIELYAPWVNKVFLITDNQKPEWLNENCKRVVLKSHADFFKNTKDLPTFNSNAIQINLHHINELSERFILFDDDFLLVRDLKKEDFFKENKPIKSADPILLKSYNICSLYSEMQFNNALLMKKSKVGGLGLSVKRFFRVISFSYLRSWVMVILRYVKSILRKKYRYVVFYKGAEHGATGFLKSVNKKAIEDFSDEANVTSRNKFRGANDLSTIFLDQYYIATDNFSPGKARSFYCSIKDKMSSDGFEKIQEVFEQMRYNTICVQDNVESVSYKEREALRAKLTVVLDKVFPQKSQFEK